MLECVSLDGGLHGLDGSLHLAAIKDGDLLLSFQGAENVIHLVAELDN
jgi:hypothetical protein